MDEREEQARKRDAENRAGLANQREERSMAAQERKLGREMDEFRDAEERTEREIEDEWRKEHWGQEPNSPPAWKRRPSETE